MWNGAHTSQLGSFHKMGLPAMMLSRESRMRWLVLPLKSASSLRLLAMKGPSTKTSMLSKSSLHSSFFISCSNVKPV